MPTEARFVSNYKDGAWDEGVLTADDKVVISECAGVLQYAQTCFEGLKAYRTKDGKVVCFRPDLNASRMADSCKRLEMPVYPEDKWVEAIEKLLKLILIMYHLMGQELLYIFVHICSVVTQLLVSNQLTNINLEYS